MAPIHTNSQLWTDDTIVVDHLLNSVYSQLNDGTDAAPTAMRQLMNGLREIRAGLGTARWRTLILAVKSHPLLDVTHEDPLTARSFRRPRGYAGDAVMLDFIYRLCAGI